MNLPEVIGRLAREERGIILVTGTTGSGKSTTLASMLNLVNRETPKHIVTIEGPIDFLHRDEKCIINQREVGTGHNLLLTGLEARFETGSGQSSLWVRSKTSRPPR